jgi:hypothetical protein
MKLFESVGAELSGPVQPRVSAKPVARCGHADHHVDGLAVI